MPLRAFVSALSKWTHAMEEESPDEARVYVEEMRIFGQLLAEDPRFRGVFADHTGDCDSSDPEHAVACLHSFLRASTEASRPGRLGVATAGGRRVYDLGE
jgi:hypothetical protein